MRIGACASALLLAGCAAAAGGGADATSVYYYCAGAISRSGPTLVVTERVYPFDGPLAAFPAAAPRLAASFAAYAASTWGGMSLAPACHAAQGESAAETARGAEVGRYEGQGYGVMRASYWQPG